jgi:hypothetical protein
VSISGSDVPAIHLLQYWKHLQTQFARHRVSICFLAVWCIIFLNHMLFCCHRGAGTILLIKSFFAAFASVNISDCGIPLYKNRRLIQRPYAFVIQILSFFLSAGNFFSIMGELVRRSKRPVSSPAHLFRLKNCLHYTRGF